jgi:thiol-disulfide isomerase/thioredoxin
MSLTNHPTTNRLRPRAVVFAGLAGIALLLLFRQRIQNELFIWLTLRAELPNESAVEEFLANSSDPTALLQRLWKTEKIPHRALVVNFLREHVPGDARLSKESESLLLAAASDGDLSAKESALSILAAARYPDLLRLAKAQTHDVDPAVRALGLRYLRQFRGVNDVADIIPLLDDPETSVVTAAATVLRSWTSNDFGLRMSMANPELRPAQSSDQDPTDFFEAVNRWKQWWEQHKTEYPPATRSHASEAPPRLRLNTSALTFTDLQGQPVRLSAFKGKIVLLNFWTTWCSACIAEIPQLAELQRRNADRLVILGVSLDGQSDVHSDDHTEEDGHGESIADGEQVREAVADFVRKKNTGYRIVLDRTGSASRRFNGNELPTNVLIDPEGHVRRRFVGGRSVAAWEAIIREVSF